ncbi:MAG: hypothetical protein R3272_03380 [Candidatus Promineifilaceae bacterium]|nr:hypothetical protein [Candidatus Promineifilaceae bacterium]
MAQSRGLLFLAFTAILSGYFMVWLPNESAGLAFIGLEMGEQIKFLPQVKQRTLGPDRTLFYLPPITLALMLLLVSARWPSHRWQTWTARALALVVSLLAFPALEQLGVADRSEWLWRLLLILFVGGVALVVSGIGGRISPTLLALSLLLMAVAGAVLPTWAYFSIAPTFFEWLRRPFSYGPGLWLNLAGHLLVAALAIRQLSKEGRGGGGEAALWS